MSKYLVLAAALVVLTVACNKNEEAAAPAVDQNVEQTTETATETAPEAAPEATEAAPEGEPAADEMPAAE